MKNDSSCVDIVKDIYGGISSPVKASFISCFVVGVVTHLYILTNKITNWDDINCFYYSGQADEAGRWFLPHAFEASSKYNNPMTHGMLAVFLFAVAAALICEALKIKTVTGAVLIGAVMITFPSMASMMTFTFTVHCYGVSIVLASLAAFFTLRYGRWGRIAGIVCLVLSTATYQMFYLVAVCILLLELVLSVFRADDAENVRVYLNRGLRYLEVSVISIVSYVVITKFGPWELGNYKGMSDMGNISLTEIPEVLARDFHRLLQFFVTDPPSYVNNFFRVINVIVVLLAAAVTVVLIRQKCGSKKKILLTLVACFLLILTSGGIYILAPQTQDASTIMIYPYIFLYIYVISVSECIGIRDGGAVRYAVPVLMAFVIYSGFLVTNGAYYRSKLALDRVSAFYNRIMVKVEEQKGYTYDQKLLVAGDYWPDPNVLSACNLDGDKYADMEGVAIENGLFTSSTRENFLKYYLGIQGEHVTDDETKKVESSDEFRSMPSYPEDGCVKKIDGVWVVKINDIDNDQ